MKNCQKFTLVELLIVVAIIAILASLLMPSLMRAKEQARVAVCVSQFKQSGIALAAYTADNKGQYPPSAGSCCSWITSGGKDYWAQYTSSNGLLNEYLGDFKDGDFVPPSKCPSATGDNFEAYGTTTYGNTAGWAPNDLAAVRSKYKIKQSSRMVALYEDGAWYSLFPETQYSQDIDKVLYHKAAVKGPRFNMTFCDGSVKANVLVPQSMLSNSTYTFDNEN